MDCKDYVKHITQKYLTNIAVAVIKSKPKDLTIENYLQLLKNNVEIDKMDIDVDICSDDFDFNDELFDLDESQTPNEEFTQILDNSTDTEKEITKNKQNNELADSIDILNYISHSNMIGNKPETALLDSQATQLYDYKKYLNKPKISSNIEVIKQSKETPQYNKRESEVAQDEKPTQNTDIQRPKTQIDTPNNEIETKTRDNQSRVTTAVVMDTRAEEYTNNIETCDQETETLNEGLFTNNEVLKTAKIDTEVKKTNEIIDTEAKMDTEVELTLEEYTNNIETCDQETETLKGLFTNNEVLKTAKIDTEVKKTNEIIDTETKMDTEVELTLEEYTQALSEKTHYSQSQDEDKRFEILEQCILGSKNDNSNSNTINGENYSQINDARKENFPFDILDKLNRIKCEINRKEGCSFDSGYRSDSQSQKLILVNSETLLYNAGESLLYYLLECKITPTTEVLIREISTVFGEFIDRLHLEEKYPPFLEYVLDNINNLLQDIFNTDSCGHNAISAKSNSITRVLLLNTSQNIIKYSIQRIIVHLKENIVDKINYKSHDGLDNTMMVENLSYVFGLLEKLLQRYIKENEITAKTNEPNTLLISSSITDIWRRKWNPNCNKKPIEYQVKDCITKRCGDVLKRIILECMESYSLVSFAALQCFNFIQD